MQGKLKGLSPMEYRT
ncbi:hypothetical protein [Haemophilus sp. oral taxon 851]